MAQYHKIWIEVDVLKEPQKKTQKIKEIIKALEKCPIVENISKCQYIPAGDSDAD